MKGDANCMQKRNLRIQVGARLRRLREELGLKREDMADILEISEGHYGKIETGVYELGYKHLVTLYHTLKFDPTYILVGEDKKFDLNGYMINCSEPERTERISDVLKFSSKLLIKRGRS